MNFEQRTVEAIVKAAILIGSECDYYECGTDEQEALMAIIEVMEVLLH